MAASTHWLATATAQSVLERGGNAFDAAVAGGFVLHIVEPHLNGPAGDLVGIVAEAGGEPVVLNGQGPAPAGATIEAMRGLGLDHMPGAGALAAAVPGSVPAWLHLLATRGTWDVADVLAPAIDLAEHGHAVSEGVCGVIARMAEHFVEHWPDSADTWMPGGVPEPGEVITNAAYAATLRRLLAEADTVAAPSGGPEQIPAGDAADGGEPDRETTRRARIDAVRGAWQEGFVAEALATAAAVPHRHSDGGDHAGVITVADQAGFRAGDVRPIHLDVRGVRIHKAGAWAQSPVLLQALAILGQFGDADLDPGTARGAHTIIEALKLALADRDAYYGAGCQPSTLEVLLSDDYAADRARQITDRASEQWRPGAVPGVSPFRPNAADELSAGTQTSNPATGEPTVRPNGDTRGDTCHLDVVDRDGNLVSITPSGGWLQSNPTVAELGFPLGTRLQMTWLDPESPSALRPGEQPRTTLSPTMLSRDGHVVEALGTPGGDQQDQWQLLYLLRTLVGGYTPQQAIDAPAFHTTAMISSFWPRERTAAGVVVESRLGDEVIAGLRERGHDVTVAPAWSLGRLSAVGRDPETGRVWAAANPRGAQGYAAGR